ncbi:hypothetical protein ARMGADRAFT_1106638 [Armillaria gallica]|uniref:Uncharacterized protein n=1 Tax=Armillaria gallica TaxID=47427 RepID=A0A2H3DJI9_ARMGA|nr:hypothetical protein ARMGADRAFT_1106638 [Armillaria gallica]
MASSTGKSGDVRSTLDALLESELKFRGGGFASSHVYSMKDAPNPCLKIDGLGLIGLPLSKRDAAAIKSYCMPYDEIFPSGRCWMMNRLLIHFHNPEWDTWIKQSVLPAICENIGVDPLRTHCELDKLLLLEPDSPDLTQDNASMDPSMFGTMNITLPSEFTGGTLCLQYGDCTRVIAFPPNTSLTTTAVGSFVNVTHHMESVTLGNRLSLTYRLLYSSEGPLPFLPNPQGVKDGLTTVFKSWNTPDTAGKPTVLACVIADEDDALATSVFNIANQLGFRVYYADIDYTLTGSVTFERRQNRDCWDGNGFDDYEEDLNGSDSDSDEDPEDFEPDDYEMPSYADEVFDIVEITDLSGMPVNIPDLQLSRSSVINGRLDNGEVKDQSYEHDYDEGTVTRTWSAQVALILPPWSPLVAVIGDAFDYACNLLEESLSTARNAEELKLVDILVQCCEDEKRRKDVPSISKAVGILRETADRWNDVDTFLLVAKRCRLHTNIDFMGIEGFVSVYLAFDWERIESFFADTIKQAKTNVKRVALVKKLAETAREGSDDEVTNWCSQNDKVVLDSLRNVKRRDVKWLISYIKNHGIDFFRSGLLPQLQKQPFNQDFWLPFLRRLHTGKGLSPLPRDFDSTISHCVLHVVTVSPLFPLSPHEPKKPNSAIARDFVNISCIKDLVQLCVDTNTIEHCKLIFKRMQPIIAVSPGAWKTYHALVPDLSQLTNSHLQLSGPLSEFFETAARQLLHNSQSITDSNTEPLLLALRQTSHAFLKQLMAPPCIGYLAKTRSQQLRNVAGLLQNKLLPLSNGDSSERNDVAEIILQCVTQIILAFDFSTLVGLSESDPSRALGSIVELFNLGFLSGCGVAASQVIFDRLLLYANQKEYMYAVLCPFIKVLLARTVRMGLQLTVPPFSAFCAKVASIYALEIMTPKPDEAVSLQLRSIGCGCTLCTNLRAFFNNGKAIHTVTGSHSERGHVEKKLNEVRAGHFKVAWETVHDSYRPILRITKPKVMRVHGAWLARSQNGQNLLASMGTEATQRQIMGGDYDWIHGAIVGATSIGPAIAAARLLANITNREFLTTPTVTGPPAKKARYN